MLSDRSGKDSSHSNNDSTTRGYSGLAESLVLSLGGGIRIINMMNTVPIVAGTLGLTDPNEWIETIIVDFFSRSHTLLGS